MASHSLLHGSAAPTPSGQHKLTNVPKTPSSSTFSDATKLEVVCAWLKDTLDTDGFDAPPFEVNSQTIDILFDLALTNRQREADVQLLIDDTLERTTLYCAEADKMENIMSAIGLSVDTLPATARTNLSCLSSLALTLDTKDTSLASFYLSMQDLEEELQGVRKEKAEQQEALSSLLAKTRVAVAKLDRLSKALEEFRDDAEKRKESMTERMSEVRYLQGKTAEAHATMQKLKEDISASGVTNEITHSALTKLNQEWRALHEKTEPLVESLKKYHQLPPDVTLARIKIEDARREVARLNQQISDALARMNISYH